MIANLMMYARPELESAHNTFWGLIRARLAEVGIDSPETLSQSADEFETWNSPNLVLSQTCGMPYRTWLHGKVTLIGTPDYGLEDCPPGYYRSPIVVRADDPRSDIAAYKDAVFAYNDTFSQSGYASVYEHTAAHGFWFAHKHHSGGHLFSARAVANGTADIAALDGVTWQLIQRFEGFANSLRVLDWTTPTPGLPYISAPHATQDAMFDAVRAAIEDMDDATRGALGIKGFVAIPAENYLSIANPDIHDYHRVGGY